MERFFRRYKTAWMPRCCYTNYREAEQDIAATMRYDNHPCGHSYNNGLSHAAAEKAA